MANIATVSMDISGFMKSLFRNAAPFIYSVGILRDRLRNLESASADICLIGNYRKYFTIERNCRQDSMADSVETGRPRLLLAQDQNRIDSQRPTRRQSPFETRSSNILGGDTFIDGILRTPPATPSSSSKCETGQIVWDADYIYVCAAPNVWKH